MPTLFASTSDVVQTTTISSTAADQVVHTNEDELVIERAYIEYLGRPAGPKELSAWLGAIAADGQGGTTNGALRTLRTTLVDTPEFKAAYVGLDSGQAVDKVYLTLFGQAADSAGRAYWADAIDSGHLTIDQVMRSVSDGRGAYDVALASKVAAAQAFTAAYDASYAESLWYVTPAAHKIGADFLASVTDEASFHAAFPHAGAAFVALLQLAPDSVPTGSVTVSGNPVTGATLHVASDVHDADGMGAIHYAWSANGVTVAGADVDTLLLTSDLAGKTIQAMANYVDGAGAQQSLASAPTGLVAPGANEVAVARSFVAYLGRPASPHELVDWTGFLAGTSNPDAIAVIGQSLAASYEFTTGFAGLSSNQAVDKVFQTLFGHAADAAGRGFWAGALDAGSLTLDQLITGVSAAAQGADAAALAGKVAAAQAFTAAYDNVAYPQELWYVTAAAHKVGADYLAGVTDAATRDAAIAHVDAAVDGLGQVRPDSPPMGHVDIGGDLVAGETLSLDYGVDDADGVGPVSFMWFANDVPVEGATGTSLVLTTDMVGKSIRAVINYVDGEGIGQGVTSWPSDRVQPGANELAVEKLYVAYLGRPASPHELAAWGTAAAATQGHALVDLAKMLAASHEFAAGFAGLSGSQAVDKVFQTVFGHAAAADARGFWAYALDNGTVTLGTVIQTVAAGAQGADAVTLHNKTQAAGAFTAAYDADRMPEDVWYVGTAAHGLGAGYLAQVTDHASLDAAVANVGLPLAGLSRLPANHPPTGQVTIEGDMIVGTSLHVNYDFDDIDEVDALHLVWVADGVPIAGATGYRLALTPDLIGKTIRVMTEYVDGAGAEQSLSSLPLYPVQPVRAELAVERAYVEYLGRPASPAELANWAAGVVATEGRPVDAVSDLRAVLAASPEFAAAFAGLNSNQVVDKVFQTLLGRPADDAARPFWAHALDTGSLAIANLVRIIGDGAQGSDLDSIINKAVAAAAFTHAYDTAAYPEHLWYVTTAAHAVGSAYLAAVSATGSVAGAVGNVAQSLHALGQLVPDSPPTGSVYVTGDAVVGHTLSAFDLLDDADGMGDVQYLWLADGVPIAGATDATLTLAPALSGKSISAMAMYVDGAGAQQAMNSLPTAPVAPGGSAAAVQRAYVEYLGRPADPAGVAFWSAALVNDPAHGIDQLRAALTTSAEFENTYAGLSSNQIVAKNYAVMFGRVPDAAGLQYWVTVLDAGQMTVAQMIRTFGDTPESDAAGILGSKVTAASMFAAAIDTPAEWAAYAGSAAYGLGAHFVASVTGPDTLKTAVAAIGPTLAAIVGLPADHAATGSVMIDGRMAVGATLGVKFSVSDVETVGSIRYQWKLDGVDIRDATGGAFTVQQAQIGHTVTVSAIYTDKLGYVTTFTSDPAASADDHLFGTGSATLAGGEGNDVYTINGPGDTIVEKPNEGIDRVEVAFAKAGTYQLPDNVEHATVTSGAAVNLAGNALDNQLVGNAAANTLTGGDGKDTLDGGAGADKLIGGAGHDTYIVDNTGDVVTEAADGGIDTVVSTLAGYTLGANVENLIHTGDTAFAGTGNALDNIVVGGSGNDKLSGLAGNDSLFGDAGNDSLAGGDGADLLNAGTGVDTVDGGAGDDTLVVQGNYADYVRSRPNATDTVLVNADTGETVTLRNVEHVEFLDGTRSIADVQDNLVSAGNDVLTGTAGTDTLDGGLGSDTLNGGQGDDVYVVNDPTDLVIERANAGTDTVNVAFTKAGTYTLAENVENATVTSANVAVGLTGNALNNFLTGNAGANVLNGGDGRDTLDGGAGADKLAGGAGDDLYVVDNAGDVVTEAAGEGIDRVRTVLAKYTLTANVETLAYTGTGAFAGTGNALDNLLVGGAGNDKLMGLAGNDTLSSGAGNDSLDGGEGSDMLDADVGIDTVDGGAGDDSLNVMGKFADYVRTRPTAGDTVLVNALAGENITLRNVEHIVFADGVKSLADVQFNLVSPGNDVLAGTNGNDTMDGGLGSDTLSGARGDDTYVVNDAADLVVEKAAEGVDRVNVAFTKAGIYTMTDNVENATVTGSGASGITGNALDNVLTGNVSANALAGGDGNDTLDGGAGSDKLAGGNGNDVYIVDAAGDTVTEAPDAGRDRVETTLAKYTLTANVEDLLYHGSAAFAGTGNASNNTIWGGAGGDKLSGLAGDDSLFGQDGNDSLAGGDGNDLLDAGTGADTVDGGAGDDVLQLKDRFANYVVTRPNATDTLLVDQASGESLLLRNVEHIVFLDGIKTIAEVQFNIQSPGNDMLVGTSGGDTLDGGLGSDTLAGGQGNDTYVVNDASDVVVEKAGEGIDRVNVAFAKPGIYAMTDNVENATVVGSGASGITGNALANVLTGNGAANSLSGGDGNDTLDGGAGADKLAGGAGDDVYIVDNAGDGVTEGADAGLDRVETALAKYTLSANVENLAYTGSAAFAGTGNASDNVIHGGAGGDKLAGLAGNDVLFGAAGNDSLAGGDGDDLLDAGTGVDTVDGGAGDDTLHVQGRFADYVRTRPNATDTVLVDAATGENILLRNVEHVTFADGARTLADVQYNVLSPGNDVLTGTAGNDTLDGGQGSDTLQGGRGDDTYAVNDATDVVLEKAGEGNDTVKVAYARAGAYLLPDNVENATVTSTAAIDLTGNALANVLTGNAAANTLAGGLGDDTLDGGAGADTLFGGAGSNTLRGGDGKDVFVFDDAAARSRVLDFASGADKLRIDQKVIAIGDGDAKVEGALLRKDGAAFAPAAELVVFANKIDGDLTAASAAAAIGSASTAYTTGASALFVVNNGHDSALYLFTSDGQDARVAAGELKELAVLVGTPGLALADIAFAA